MIGIFVNALVKFRSKRYADAIFNSIGWLLFLPGLVLLLLGDVSPILKTIDNVMLYTGLVFCPYWRLLFLRDDLFQANCSAC